jgi:hypothetical protein
MQTMWRRKAFLTGMGLLFLLSFSLPATGEWGRPEGWVRGWGALFASVLLLLNPSVDEGRGLILAALSAQSNLFFICGWFSLRHGSSRSGSRGEALLLAWGFFSLGLALTPLLSFGPKQLLAGYYLWALMIGMLTTWLCYRGTQHPLRHPPPEESPGFASRGKLISNSGAVRKHWSAQE